MGGTSSSLIITVVAGLLIFLAARSKNSDPAPKLAPPPVPPIPFRPSPAPARKVTGAYTKLRSSRIFGGNVATLAMYTDIWPQKRVHGAKYLLSAYPELEFEFTGGFSNGSAYISSFKITKGSISGSWPGKLAGPGTYTIPA